MQKLYKLRNRWQVISLTAGLLATIGLVAAVFCVSITATAMWLIFATGILVIVCLFAALKEIEYSGEISGRERRR